MLRIYDKYSTMLNRLWNLQSIGKKGIIIIMLLFDYKQNLQISSLINEHRKKMKSKQKILYEITPKT